MGLGYKSSMAPKDDKTFDIEAAQSFMRNAMIAQQVKIARWGEQGPPITAVVKGLRAVASYSTLLRLPETATYHDFLGLYIKHAIGEGWWLAEVGMPDDQAHQLIRWQRKVTQFQVLHTRGEGLQSAPGTGVIGHYYRLAFDLHTLHHQGLVQNRLIQRLKNKGNFQGARYEVAVCAAFVRAGFEISLVDEDNSPHRVCELVATHKRSSECYAVEAKSRHISGVLGHPKSGTRRSEKEPRVKSLIKDALKKVVEYPRVICIDVNYPQPAGKDAPSTWGRVVRRQVNALEALGRGPAMLVFTNSPLHYLKDDEPARETVALIMGLNERAFNPQDIGSLERDFPGLIRAANAFGISIPSQWD